MNSIQKSARVAGSLYLVYLVFQIFTGTLRGNLVVLPDTAGSLKDITSNEWLFRLDFMSDILAALFFLLSAWALYVLLKSVDENFALLFLLLNLGGVGIQAMNALNQLTAVLILRGADYLQVFQAYQLQALAMFFLDLNKNGFIIAQVFYGAWLFPLGYLVFKSGFLPQILGILLMLDFLGVLIWFFQFFLFPGYDVITYPGLAVSFIAEVSLSLWLLIKGVNGQNPALIAAG